MVIAAAKKLSAKGYAAAKSLRTEKAKLYHDILALAVDEKSNESREMTAEDSANADKMQARMTEIEKNVKRIEEYDPGEDVESRQDRQNPQGGDDRQGDGKRAALQRRSGESLQAFQTRERRTAPEYEAAFFNYFLTRQLDSRAVQADVDLAGGALVMPERLSNQVIKAVDNILWFERYSTVTNVEDSASLGIPTLETNANDAEWTTEISSIAEDTGLGFGKRSLVPTPIRKRVKVSERFLRLAMADAAFASNDTANGVKGPRNLIVNRLAYAIASTKELAFMLGNGVGKPLGIFTASNRGIPASRDIATGSPTGLTYPGLVNIKFNQKIQYHATSMWIVNKAFVATAMKLVDTNGRPILNFSTIPNTPDTLLGNQIMMSEYVPSAFTTGAYVGVFGDLTYYYIANSLQMTLAVADQLYLETGQIGMFMGAESDGMPVLAEAFTRIKCS